MCGTLDYLPPEMCRAVTSPYDKTIDIWSLGVLAYEFCVGKPPFEDSNERVTKARILKKDIKFPDHISEEAKDFIQGCLQLNSEERPTFEEIFGHPWID